MVRPQKIKSELVEREITQAQIAKMLKVTPASVNKVITGHRKNPRIREAIALALSKPVSDIWPELAERKEDRK